jgi:diguanylate cyclase (GGDEF)-like protein
MSQNTVLIVVIVLQQGLFGLLWLILARMRLARSATLHWAASMVLVSVGLSFVVLRPHLPTWLGIWGANACTLAAFALARRGVEIFARQAPADKETLVVLLVALGCSATIDWAESPALRIAVSSTAQGWMLLRAGSVIWRELTQEFGAALARGIAAIVLALAAVFLMRAVYALLHPAALGISLNGDQVANTYTVVAFLAAGLLLNMGLIGLVLARMLFRLQRLSERDGLTGLFNRRAIEKCLKAELDRLRRYQEPFSLLAFDMDHFKAVNDAFGHPAGDAVLRELGNVVRSVSRQSDLAGRSGGEEFWLVLPHTRLAGATKAAQRLLAAVQGMQVKELEGRRQLSVSIGVAVVEAHGETLEGLLRRADKALYQAKHAGRNRVEFAPPWFALAEQTNAAR